jgi:cell division protein FtsW
MKKVTLFSYMDKVLLFLSIAFSCIGVVLILSASSIAAVLEYETSPYMFFAKQIIYSLIGYIAGFIMIKFHLKYYKKISKYYKKLSIIYLLGVILLLIYLLLYGKITNNAKSWIRLGPISIQPSEFAKSAIILYMGYFFGDENYKTKGKYAFLIPIIVSMIVFVLVALQPDLGTAVIIAAIAFFIFLSVPLKFNKEASTFKILAGAVGVIILVVFLKGDKFLSFLTDAQISRLTYKEPCTRYTDETGYQVCNGFIAIHNGGLTGLGLGASTQKYMYLPESHTDFIFPIIVEELGVIFGVILIICYLIMLYRIFIIAKSTYRLSNSIICYGIIIYILSHLLLNFGGILALIPLTGVPLPFLSYGGSFNLNVIISMFIVQIICIENNMTKQKIEIKKI